MLTIQQKIGRLNYLQDRLDKRVATDSDKIGLCGIYKSIQFPVEIELKDDIPELFKRTQRSFTKGMFYSQCYMGYWWVIGRYIDQPSFYYIKRTRAIQETIKELESKL